MATDKIPTEQFEGARVEEYVDGDVDHQLAKTLTVSNMLFTSCLRFVLETFPANFPRDGLSNLIFRVN